MKDCWGGGGAPSSASDDEGSVDSDVAGAASLAVAEAVSSANFAGVASPADLAGAFPAELAGAFPADLAGMAFPAIAGVASPAVLAGMAVPAVAGVASLAVLAGMAVPAVVGAASLAVVEVATSTDRMEAAGSLSVCGSRNVCDCLSPDGYVTDSDAVVLPDGVELGNPTVVAVPTTGVAQPVAAGGQMDPDLAYSDGQIVTHGRKAWTCRRTITRPLWSEPLARVLLGFYLAGPSRWKCNI